MRRDTELISKIRNLTYGYFKFDAIKDTVVEINKSNILEGNVPENLRTVFTVIGNDSTNTYFINIHYDGSRLIAYSNVSQRITVFWISI